MPRKSFSEYCSFSGDERTISIDYMEFPFAADPASRLMKCGFECDKYLYGHCPCADTCPLYKKA